MAEENPKLVDSTQHQSTTTTPPADQTQTTTTQDESKPTIMEGTDVAAPAAASVIPNDTPAQTGPTMGVSSSFQTYKAFLIITTGTLRY